MKNKNHLIALVITGIALILVIVFYIGSSASNANTQPITTVTGTPTSIWNAFQESTPVAFLTPLPDSVKTLIDGIYTKVDDNWPQWWRCMRCGDYRMAGGIWKLQFDQGVMRIFYDVTGWRSIASYTVEDNKLYIYNDPYCPDMVGEYTWSVENGELSLATVNDPCAFDLREENLSKESWNSCDSEDAVGCEEKRDYQANIVPANLSVNVNIYGGDSRFFATPPDVITHANVNDIKPQAGIEILFGDGTLPYGIQRVLWWEENGTWIEATTSDDYQSMGVQFLGEQSTGWARVLFDGVEVWRGNTSGIWSKDGRYGGFIEISGYESGMHTIRVEALGFDYRPIPVASFGFSRGGNIQP